LFRAFPAGRARVEHRPDMLWWRFYSGSMVGKITAVGVYETPPLAFSPGHSVRGFFARAIETDRPPTDPQLALEPLTPRDIAL
jgi:hypothetical protein